MPRCVIRHILKNNYVYISREIRGKTEKFSRELEMIFKNKRFEKIKN